MSAETSAPVLVFERRGHAYCCPVADVLEIVEEPALDHPGYPAPLLAGVLLHDGVLVPALDPASVFDHPPEARGDAILIGGPAGTVGLLADRVVGFRVPASLSPVPWVPAGRICRSAAVIDGVGRVFLFGADGLGDVPAVPMTPAPADDGGIAAEDAGSAAGAMHLVFTIAGRGFAAAYSDVRRILHRQRCFRIPGAVPPIRHAVEMIGAVVPVLDLAGSDVMPERAEFVVLTSSVGPLALRVDRIERPLPLVPDETDPGWFPTPGLAGIARHEDRPYAVVTGASLLRDLIDDLQGAIAEAVTG